MTSALGPARATTESVGRHGRAGAAATAELPLYAQIKHRLKWEIVSGVYGRGECLPSADELGKKYGANKNTILRALRMLRGEGLIDFGRGRGAVVVHSAGEVGLADISEQLQRVVNLADASGIPRSAIIAAVQRIPRATTVRGQRARPAGSPGATGRSPSASLRTRPRGAA